MALVSTVKIYCDECNTSFKVGLEIAHLEIDFTTHISGFNNGIVLSLMVTCQVRQEYDKFKIFNLK